MPSRRRPTCARVMWLRTKKSPGTARRTTARDASPLRAMSAWTTAEAAPSTSRQPRRENSRSSRSTAARSSGPSRFKAIELFEAVAMSLVCPVVHWYSSPPADGACS